MAEDTALFFPPVEILEALGEPVEPAAGTTGLLMAAMSSLRDPLLSNPPFALVAEA